VLSRGSEVDADDKRDGKMVRWRREGSVMRLRGYRSG
jgi:hypothetical protein